MWNQHVIELGQVEKEKEREIGMLKVKFTMELHEIENYFKKILNENKKIQQYLESEVK